MRLTTWFAILAVLGVLVFIVASLPTYYGHPDRANDKAAQSGVRNALVAAKTIFTDTDDYSTVTTTSMTATEPSLTYLDNEDSTGPSVISISTSTTNTSHDTVYLTALSKLDKCFGVTDVAATGTTFYTLSEANGACAAADASGATGTSW